MQGGGFSPADCRQGLRRSIAGARRCRLLFAVLRIPHAAVVLPPRGDRRILAQVIRHHHIEPACLCHSRREHDRNSHALPGIRHPAALAVAESMFEAIDERLEIADEGLRHRVLDEQRGRRRRFANKQPGEHEQRVRRPASRELERVVEAGLAVDH
jgi:hypothetical protein